jgi:hypothetical protein
MTSKSRIALFPESGLFSGRRLAFYLIPSVPGPPLLLNKSQGQSLETVGVDLRYRAFSHGQLYVELLTFGASLSCFQEGGRPRQCSFSWC